MEWRENGDIPRTAEKFFSSCSQIFSAVAFLLLQSFDFNYNMEGLQSPEEMVKNILNDNRARQLLTSMIEETVRAKVRRRILSTALHLTTLLVNGFPPNFDIILFYRKSLRLRPFLW